MELTQLLEFVKHQEDGGQVTAAWDGAEWTLAVTWGKEAPDSDMAGAAAYGIAPTLQEAADKARREIEGAPDNG